MSTSLLLRFPWGRIHATPWGAHVNEGRVELPPSPWRLLRALYSTWKVRRPDLDEATVVSLLERLAEPPTCFVPPHLVSSTRHYYPDSTHRRGVSGATDLTLDAFASIDPTDAIAFHWPFDLDDRLLSALRSLAASTPYFGRADSLCEIECRADWSPPHAGSFVPTDLDEDAPAGEVVELLTPTLPLDLESLVLRPVDVRRRRLRYPEGSQLLTYRASTPTPEPPRRSRRTRSSERPTHAVRLGVVGPVRPPSVEAVNVADRLRRAALSRLGERGQRKTRPSPAERPRATGLGAVTATPTSFRSSPTASSQTS